MDSLKENLKKFDPFYIVAYLSGNIVGISFSDALQYKNQKLDNTFNSSELYAEYNKAVKEGLLKFVDECVSSLHGRDRGIYFPTKRILDPVFEKR